MLGNLNFKNISFSSFTNDFERGFLVLIFGRMGSGKSVSLTKMAIESLNRGYIVYTNYNLFWYGKLYLIGKLHVYINRFLKRPKFVAREKRYLTYLYKQLVPYARKHKILSSNNFKKDEFGSPIIDGDPCDPEKVYSVYADLNNKISSQKNFIKKIQRGYFQSHFHNLHNLRRIEGIDDIMKIEGEGDDGPLSIIIVDEAHNTFPAIDPRKIPEELLAWLTHIRKNNIALLVASQRITSVWNMVRVNSTYMLHLNKLRLGPFGTYFIANKYYADKSQDGIPDWDTEEPATTFVYTGRKWFKHYQTFEKIKLISKFKK
jgi:energy-coupling factor transporter ATP-binding protein EcfA2